MMGEHAPVVAVIGAGTMGAGIAQVAAAHGWQVKLKDVDQAIAERAINSIRTQLAKLRDKGRMTPQAAADAADRLATANEGIDLSECSLVVEAIVEDISVKTRVLRELLSHLPHHCIIATNTSSLSISAIGHSIGQPHRTVGMHFFNPAPIMQLVEVISGRETYAETIERVASIAEAWGKKVARAADVPGFIVNHVARPYYLEAFRILESGLAGPAEIDDAMKSLGGFRMGPFELTDFIGHDVNAATTRNVWEQLGKPPLLRPSALQESLVAQGHLGRKTRCGVYDYATEPPATARISEHRAAAPPRRLLAGASEFARLASPASSPAASETAALIFSRVLAAIIVQAHLANERGVATPDDIDTAMKYGVNYPRGPFEWTRLIGPPAVCQWLRVLNDSSDDNRFATPATLTPADCNAVRSVAP